MNYSAGITGAFIGRGLFTEPTIFNVFVCLSFVIAILILYIYECRKKPIFPIARHLLYIALIFTFSLFMIYNFYKI